MKKVGMALHTKISIFVALGFLVYFLLFFSFQRELTGQVISGISLSDTQLNIGDSLVATINVTDVVDLYGVDITISFDGRVINFISFDESTFLNEGGAAQTEVPNTFTEYTNNVSNMVITRVANATGVSGSGNILIMNFQAVASGISNVALEEIIASDSNGVSIDLTILNSSLVVNPSASERFFNFTYDWSHWDTDETTNFSIINSARIKDIPGVKFVNSNGRIEFLENLKLTRNINLDQRIKITDKKIWIDSSSIPEFNKSALLTFNNINFANPIAKRDAVDCPLTICGNTIFDSNLKTYSFEVNGFSLYEVWEQCLDGIQNYDETGVDCGGSCSACSVGSGPAPSSGGGGGGGGGGYLTTIVTEPSITQIQYSPEISPETKKIFKDFHIETRIKEIQFEVNSKVQNVKITVLKYDGIPEPVSVAKSGSIYRYLEIETENISSNLESSTISFFVEKQWVFDNKFGKKDVSLFRFDENSREWNKIETIFSEEDGTYYYYASEVSSFSYFAIAGEKTVSFIERINFGDLRWVWVVIIIILVVVFIIYRRNKTSSLVNTDLT